MSKNDTSSQIRLLFERVDALLGLRPNARAKQALTLADRAKILEDARLLAARDSASRVPVGSIMLFAADSAPLGYLALNGGTQNRVLYRGLWAFAQGSGILAATEGGKDAEEFGPGDGESTFSLPDHTASTFTHTIACIKY